MMTKEEWEEYKENLRQLNHTIDLAQVCELLEELNWRE